MRWLFTRLPGVAAISGNDLLRDGVEGVEGVALIISDCDEEFLMR